MGILQRKIKEKEKRHRIILSAAKRTFFKYGFNESSMELIAKQAQLSKGTLYLYFQSKDDLYLSLLEEGLKILKQQILGNYDDNLNVELALLKLAEAYIKFAYDYPEYYKILFGLNSGELFNPDKVRKDLCNNLNQLQEEIFMMVVNMIKKGINENIFIPNLNPHYLVVQIWVSLNGALKLTMLDRKPHFIENVDASVLATDIIKAFIMAYTSKNELRVDCSSEILKNAFSQAPSSYPCLDKVKENIKN